MVFCSMVPSIAEASPIVPDLTISTYGSSCISLFLPFFSCLLFILLASPTQDGMSRNRMRKKRRDNETKKDGIA